MKKRNISVTKLAYFYANPVLYEKHRGKAYNPAAAKKGVQYHKQLSKKPLFSLIFVVICSLCYLYFFLQR